MGGDGGRDVVCMWVRGVEGLSEVGEEGRVEVQKAGALSISALSMGAVRCVGCMWSGGVVEGFNVRCLRCAKVEEELGVGPGVDAVVDPKEDVVSGNICVGTVSMLVFEMCTRGGGDELLSIKPAVCMRCTLVTICFPIFCMKSARRSHQHTA